MKTKIISAFPGCGKSHFFKNQTKFETILDSDSSTFDKSDFPRNYIEHIKENVGKADIIFVSSHDVVRDALLRTGLNWILLYPKRELKQEYIQRYRERGNDGFFVELLEKNWDIWMDELESQEGCIHVPLFSDEFISTVFQHKII